MATVTASLTLTSSDLLTDSLSITTSMSKAAVDGTSGLGRKKITSTAKGTASGQVVLTTASEYTSVFDDAGGDLDIVYLAGGDWCVLPIFAGAELKCYAATSGTIVEWMVFGTAA